MDEGIEKPRVVSTTPTAVHLSSSFRGEPVVIAVSTEVIEQAFQVSSSTERDRRELVETNIDAIWHIASRRIASGRTDRGSSGMAIELEAAELVNAQMHMTGDPARKAAD